MASPAKKLETIAETKKTVVVGCRVPNGLVLRFFRETKVSEPVLGGGTRESKVFVPREEEIKINGPAVPYGKQPHTTIIGGYGLTYNVPADLFAEWMKQNEDSDIVKNGLIFAHADEASAQAEARDNRTNKSGLEQIDTTIDRKDGASVPRDTRLPRSRNRNLVIGADA